MAGIYHLENAARRKLKASPDWKAFRFEVVTGGYILTGEVPVGIFKSGPRKGSPKWTLPGRNVVLSDLELEAEEALYAKTTGNCPSCLGTKETFYSWSKVEGTKNRPCKDCMASGKAVVPA